MDEGKNFLTYTSRQYENEPICEIFLPIMNNRFFKSFVVKEIRFPNTDNEQQAYGIAQ